MKSRIAFFAAVVLCGLIVWARPAQSQESKGDGTGMKAPSPEEMKKMQEGMKKWQDSIAPGKHHEALNHFVGSWKTTTKLYWGEPGSPAIETTGASDIRWVLGKRFLVEEHHGEMMMPDESGATEMKKVPYEGIGTMGYDNLRNMYVSSWISNLQTNLMTMKGVADPSGMVFRAWGEMDEPMLDVYGRYVEFVTRIINDDKHVFEIIDLHAGDDYKVMEITYERKN